MIELFDPARLRPRHDRTGWVAAGVLALGAVAVGGHALWLQQRITAVADERQALKTALQTALHKALALRTPAADAAPPAALLADLERQAQRLEAASGADGDSLPGLRLSASQWLERLDALASPQVALLQVEIDRAGSTRVEGQVRSPQALAAYVQAWERLQSQAPMRARAVEVRQDTLPVAAGIGAGAGTAVAAAPAGSASAPLLRFTLRAQAAETDAAAARAAGHLANQPAELSPNHPVNHLLNPPAGQTTRQPTIQPTIQPAPAP